MCLCVFKLKKNAKPPITMIPMMSVQKLLTTTLCGIPTSYLQSSITHLAIIYILQQDKEDIGYINSAIYSCYIKYYGQKSNALLVNYNSMRVISTITSNAGLTQLFIFNNRINQSVFTKDYISVRVFRVCVYTDEKSLYLYSIDRGSFFFYFISVYKIRQAFIK